RHTRWPRDWSSDVCSSDLYYRLKVIEINVPPLRDRQEEIPQLLEFFTAKYAKRYNKKEPALAPTLVDALQNYSWPGNVRELENRSEERRVGKEGRARWRTE